MDRAPALVGRPEESTPPKAQHFLSSIPVFRFAMTTETPLATETPSPETAVSSTTPDAATADPRALTIPNVERVLDELRPYLMADGGNVEIVEIDGPIVKVRLQGACGSCPSSTMTLKMGIERKLREAIPEVSEVIQVL